MPLHGSNRTANNVILLTIIFFAIEFLDEVIDGLCGAAWPLIRHDLNLDYVQVGMLLTIPNTISSLIEPIVGIWGDIGKRRQLILGGGVSFAIALLLLSQSYNFSLLLAAFVLFYPASGCFVSLSQATLMDIEPTRHEQNMARWALAGSVGNVIGPLILGGAVALNQSWRSAFLALALLTLLLVGMLRQFPIKTVPSHIDEPLHSFQDGIANTLTALKRRKVLLWLTLLQFSDLMLDILRSFLALYFVDIVGADNTQASFAVTVWLGFGLLGDFLLIPLLEKLKGLHYLKLSATIVLCLYPIFLLVPNTNIKLVILGLLGFCNAGWYSILQGQLYTAMPGQSGTVMTLNNLFGLVGGLIPLVLGLVAQYYGLQTTMWLLLAAPITLLIALFTV
ncbi:MULTISPECIES: MFS transporter [unclassified Tolypothrix]|uniref:MFS transporter n=1 Tax=unclassified Tolypothrix TaxID=2649714 RepID=UPI0005EAA844|nr:MULTISPECIES: MFS transporter [unclassified Tolypothrix]BAY89261.1 putative fosmidomycin resistance protein [Microchaete diplosiphon NIES-3275]EKE97746.1 transporter, major facilitator family protein [Tolypothrix sp. PCC 7601]MBE9082262.1 MFS transporter [Tolypothrix sp. LEGE 11397]UYD23549.1 MFS transporter [Tolypothrix sp. PCC 7712]UYD34223.1 MFS transporter [Tolypothrix sp. PCC 7601]